MLDTLFDTATLHALHKLRMHSDSTVGVSGSALVHFANGIRRFKDITCTAYPTTELPKESAARARQQARRDASRTQGASSNLSTVPNLPSPVVAMTDTTNVAPAASEPVRTAGPARRREFNNDTYKFHSLGDYVRTITSLGTTDSYTTHIVSSRRIFRYCNT